MMITRTERFEADTQRPLLGGIHVMEEAGWAVRQLAVIDKYVCYVVFEREA